MLHHLPIPTEGCPEDDTIVRVEVGADGDAAREGAVAGELECARADLGQVHPVPEAPLCVGSDLSGN